MNKDVTAVLLIHCPDKKGIVAEVTNYINNHNGNIVYLDQYVDQSANQFFMRIEWELDNFNIPREEIELNIKSGIAQQFDMYWELYFSDIKPRMAVFVSKLSHCLFDILSRYSTGEWNVEIPLIISNHDELRSVSEKFDIPYYHIPVTKDNKVEAEHKELELLKEYKIDFIVLARYMQIISENFINSYVNRIINIHHSFLPAFPGAKPYHSAYERGVKIIGATSHYVTSDLDAGPIIEQDIVRVTHHDSVKDLIRKGRDIEKLVLARAIRQHFRRKVLSLNNRTVVFA